MEAPSFLVRLLHSVPHVNITLHRVNDTFNPNSNVYIESLGILASIPAALLIFSLVGFLLYLLTRCCDRKPRKSKSQTCQKCTLITTTLLCCAAIGLGLYGNDDFHNGLLQSFQSGRQIKGLMFNFTNKTEKLKHGIRTKVLMSDLEDIFEKPAFNQTALKILLDNVRLVRENTTRAVSALETVLYLIRSPDQQDSLRPLLMVGELYESIRWPATLGLLTVLLLLCTILVIGVARSSRCALIFFSVFGLFGVIICWLLSGIYLATSVALGDFCMQPNEYLCNMVSMKRLDDANYLNCGSLRNRFILRLNESRDNFERARESFQVVSAMSKDLYPRIELSKTIEQIDQELDGSKHQILILTKMLDKRSVERNYITALKGLCNGGLFGLSLMMIASLISAFLLTILVCVDSHTWIYLTKRRSYMDKSETTPFLNSSASTSSPTAPILSGSSTINRTLLHHQQAQGTSSNVANVSSSRNGTSTLRGLAYSGESPPPDYNIVVHDSRLSGHHTLGRLPSQQLHTASMIGPNNGSLLKPENTDKKLDKDPREVPLNGFNRFDPKYISIGPKSLRDSSFAAAASKCATLRHGGRYGGNLDKNHGAVPSPNLKKAPPPSISSLSKDYNQANLPMSYDKVSTLPHKKKLAEQSATNRDTDNIQHSSVFSIDSSSNYRSTQQRTATQYSQKPPAKILNQPLPEIPQSSKSFESSKIAQQPLSAANLNQYRSLQRPTSKSNQNRNIPCKDIEKPNVAIPPKMNPPNVVPPMLPPKNRHKDDINIRSKPNFQTLQSSKSQNFSQNRVNMSTHSTFGYDKGQNTMQWEGKKQNESKRQQQQVLSGVSYVEQYKSTISKPNYQTMPHQPKNNHGSSKHTNSTTSQQQHGNNGTFKEKTSSKHHGGRKDDAPVYYRSLQRGLCSNSQPGNDMYSVTEL